MTAPAPPPPLVQFLALYHDGDFWESHEVLEGPWRRHGSAFYQGLILYASAWVHWQRGNAHGVGAQLAKAGRRLSDHPAHYLGVDVGAIREHCRIVRGTLDTHPDDWAGRIAPLPLACHPTAIRGDEMELTAGA